MQTARGICGPFAVLPCQGLPLLRVQVSRYVVPCCLPPSIVTGGSR